MVLDIETVGHPFDSFDEAQREYLLRYAEDEEERERQIERLNLWAPTAELAAAGLLNADTNRGRVYYRAAQPESWTSEDGQTEFISGSEHEILGHFWEDLAHYDRFITFNGRGFDGPFLMLRSAILGIPARINLLPYRYSAKIHCDLLDQLTFYGATRKFSLDFFCRAFGIPSPKGEGITGLDINRLYAAGEYRRIAEYCYKDLQATRELFLRWSATLDFKSFEQAE